MGEQALVAPEEIQRQIYTIRDFQVMLDSDLAKLYMVGTKVLNQAVKRNKQRFPEEFCFRLTGDEFKTLKSQIVTSSWGGRRTSPYVFTEQGVAMLSAVLKSDAAIDISVKIINAFVAMRRFITSNALVFQRLDNLEFKQSETDRKIERVLDALESGDARPKQGIFFDGQVFDAHLFVSDLIRSADESIVIIDNYADESVLALLLKRKEGVQATILSGRITETLVLDVEKFNRQHQPVSLKEFGNVHDRFVIIDGKMVYHIGASLKDLGRKWFAFSRMDIGALDLISKLENVL